MTYRETIEYLYNQLPVYHRVGKAAYKADLKNSQSLDLYFNHPHRKFVTVHVAGTNGKGSVSHMIASVLQEAGYSTGLYTSPHLRDYRERIKINGVMIPEEEVISFVDKHKGIIDSLNPSFFEMSVAMAFDYFARSAVDIAVIEVGLGGRLDSTNIITPVLSVITNIGHDHMDLLGNTLEKVAAEKAGIIKENVPVIIGEKMPGIGEVFMEKAIKMNSELIFAEDLYQCRLQDFNMTSGFRNYFLIQKDNSDELFGETPLGGDYQSKNIPVAASAITVLKRKFQITTRNLLEGIMKTMVNTGLEGRWQVLGREPLIICDTGHNKEGIEYVMKQLSRLNKATLHMIIGFVNDKDLSSVLPLFPKDATYYFTKASVPRALDENILKEQAFYFGMKGNTYINVDIAVKAAIQSADKSDVIFIGGSTFIVGDLLMGSNPGFNFQPVKPL
jgi:dihydrofolate synthase / folylpolyglutamate synthase